MADYNFNPQVNPMQGVSLADLVASKASPLTTVLQQAPAIMQALNAQKQQQIRQQNIQTLAGGDPRLQAALLQGMDPSILFKQKQRNLLSPEISKVLSDKLKVPLPYSGQFYEDEIAGLKALGSDSKGGVQRGTPEWNTLRDSIIDKTASLDDAFRGFSQAQRQYMIADIKSVKPDFSFPESKGTIKATTEALAYPGSQQAQRFIRTARSTLPQLKTLDNLSQNVSRSQIQIANRLGQQAASQFGNRETNRLKTQVNQIALNMQRLYPTGSDEKLNLDLANLNQAQTVEQLHDSISLIFKDIVNMRNSTEGRSLDYLYPDEEKMGLFPKTKETGATGSSVKSDPLGIL